MAFSIVLDENNQFIAKAKEEIQPMKTLCSFELNDMFHRDALGPAYFSKSYPSEKLTKDIQSFLKLVFPKQFPKLMMIFLYHIYNYEHSKYRPWIQTFPEKINSLVGDLTFYEMQLLHNDQAFGFIENFVDIAQREFKVLELELKKKFNKDEFTSFFNNKPFTIADYMFARNIVQITGQGSDSAVHEILLNPCSLFIGKKVLESEIPIETQQQNFDSENQPLFNKLADREFHSGDQIVENFHYPYAYQSFVLHGQVPKGSKTDCVELQIYDSSLVFKDAKLSYPKKTLLNLVAENGFVCIGNNEIGISRVVFLGKIMNMFENEIKECYQAFKEAGKRADQQFQFNVLKEDCANPNWNAFDPRIATLASLEENLKKNSQQMRKAQEYYELRKIKKKPFENAQLIQEYFQEKHNVILALKQKISQLSPRQKQEEVQKDEL